MWGGGAGRTGQVTDRLETKRGCGRGGGCGELILNVGGPHPRTGQAPLLQGGRQAKPWPRSLLGHPGRGQEEREGGSEREGVPASGNHAVCGGGEGSRSQGSSPPPPPAPAVCSQFWSLSSPPGCPVASALGHGWPDGRWWGAEPRVSCLPRPGFFLDDPALPTLLVTPPRGWVVCRDHLGRGAHNLLLPAPTRHPAWLLPATACSSRWAGPPPPGLSIYSRAPRPARPANI